jgi:hypothetical protein
MGKPVAEFTHLLFPLIQWAKGGPPQPLLTVYLPFELPSP